MDMPASDFAPNQLQGRMRRHMDNPHPIVMTVNRPLLQADLSFPTITLSGLRHICETEYTFQNNINLR